MKVDKNRQAASDIARKGRSDEDKPSVLLIEGRFYDEINDELLRGAINELKRHGCGWEVVSVPGALEIPVAMGLAIENDVVGPDTLFRGVVALGCVIRGETSHYDIVANESARALMTLATDFGIPLGNAILTTDTLEQAKVRADRTGYDKGGHAVRACLSLAAIQDDFAERDPLDDDEDDA